MAMGIKATIKTSMSAVGTTLGTVDSTATFLKNFVDEAIEVQESTKDLRVAKAILAAERDLVADTIALTEEEKAAIAILRTTYQNKSSSTPLPTKTK